MNLYSIFLKNLQIEKKIITENRELIEHNYKLMQLYAPSISVQGKKKLQYAVENFVFEANFTEVKKMMIEDGFGTVDFSELFATIKRIVADNNIKD